MPSVFILFQSATLLMPSSFAAAVSPPFASPSAARISRAAVSSSARCRRPDFRGCGARAWECPFGVVVVATDFFFVGLTSGPHSIRRVGDRRSVRPRIGLVCHFPLRSAALSGRFWF